MRDMGAPATSPLGQHDVRGRVLGPRHRIVSITSRRGRQCPEAYRRRQQRSGWHFPFLTFPYDKGKRLAFARICLFSVSLDSPQGRLLCVIFLSLSGSIHLSTKTTKTST